MYSSFQLAKKYLRYYLTASNSKGHGMHSPFVFQFITHVLNNNQGYRPPAAIEQVRKQLLHDETVLTIEDFGAGSRTGSTKNRTVAQVAKTALKPKKYGQVLFRLAKFYAPQHIIELGTSLGITTAYLAAANANAKVITIEGSAAIAAVAKQNFTSVSMHNINLAIGSFDDQLPLVLAQQSPVHLAYIDGNHRFHPTLTYFNSLLPHLTNDAVLVFDDIHWSAGMEQAWEQIKKHPSVRCTIDIFFLGFVFFRSEFKVARHFTIRY